MDFGTFGSSGGSVRLFCGPGSASSSLVPSWMLCGPGTTSTLSGNGVSHSSIPAPVTSFGGLELLLELVDFGDVTCDHAPMLRAPRTTEVRWPAKLIMVRLLSSVSTSDAVPQSTSEPSIATRGNFGVVLLCAGSAEDLAIVLGGDGVAPTNVTKHSGS